MKKVIFISLMMITSVSFAQLIKIDSISFIKSGVEEPILDTSITNNLEAFKDKDDAIIYLYRLSSMAGAAVKWQVQVDNNDVVKLGQKEYIVTHINTTEKSHYVTYPDMKYNYVNFKPNRYYYIMLKGFDLRTGYLDAKAFKDIKTCKSPKPKTK
jgi:hypothetical protein